MRRVERARLIRDAILAHPREEWRWTTVSGERHLQLDCDRWQACLRTAFSGPHAPPPPAPTYLHALVFQQTAARLPNLLDLWVSGQRKVLSLEWDGDDLRLISMKPGPWEFELFGVGEAR